MTHATPSIRRGVWAVAAAVVLATFAAVPAARADSITVGGIKYDNIRIVGLREGKLYVLLPSGERPIDLGDIQSLELELYPELSKADAAMDKKDWAAAANLYEPLYDKVTEDYLKVLVGAKMVVALDKSGRFERALQRYAELMRSNPQSTLVQAAAPTTVPTEKTALDAAKKRAEMMLENEADPFVKEFLQRTVKRLEGEKVMEDRPAGVGPAILVGEEEASRDLIQEAIDAGKTDEALKMIDEKLALPRQELSKLLWQKGQAMLAKKEPKEAAVSFMRVVVHYRPASTEHYAPALLGAAEAFIAMQQPHHAKALLDEAAGVIGDGDDEATAALRQKLEQLRAQLPK